MKRELIVPVLGVFFIILLSRPVITFAASERPIELKFAHFNPVGHQSHVEIHVPTAKEIEERTKGRVKITIYPSEALGRARDDYDMAVRGVADMSVILHAYTPGRFPLTSVMELPLHIPSSRVGSLVHWELYNKYLKNDYSGVKVLYVVTTDPGHIHMASKPVRTLDDLKGLRLRSPGPQQNAILKALGGSPVNLPAPDVYDALSRGMVDGVVLPFSGLRDFKLQEVTKYHDIVPLYVTTSAIVMNLKKWNSLPPDIQKIFEETYGARLAEKHGMVFDRTAQLAMEEIKKTGGNVFSLPPEQLKIWYSQLTPIIDKWIADMDAKGLPGKKVYEEARSLVEKYSK